MVVNLPKKTRSRFTPLPRVKIPFLIGELSHSQQERRSSALSKLLLFEAKHLLPHFDGLISSFKQEKTASLQAKQLVYKVAKRLGRKKSPQGADELLFASSLISPLKAPGKFAQLYSEMRHNGLNSKSTPSASRDYWHLRAITLLPREKFSKN